MKKIIEWLQTIQDPEVRERAIRNREEWVEGHSQDFKDQTARSLKYAIYNAFSWKSSNEGDDYWLDFWNDLPDTHDTITERFTTD